MRARRPFDLSQLDTADKVLLAGSGILFVDSFLSWQRVCGGSKAIHLSICLTNANEWGGAAPLVGILAALCTLALLAWRITNLAGVDLGLPVSPRDAGDALVLGAVLLTVLKFVLVIGRALAYGAWIGLILTVVIAYGGYMKRREADAIPTGDGAGFTA